MVKIKKESLLVFLIILIAFFLRVYHLNTDLLFHRDQGLHSLSIYNIWHDKKLSLLGHPSDVDGLIHAPIYYWLMTPAYALSQGSPFIASLFQIVLEMLSLPLFYLSLKKLFNKKTAITTLILYTFSYGFVSLSRWLVNVTPILPLTHLLLFLLIKKYKDNFPLNPFWPALIAGVIAQLNAAIGPFLLPIIIFVYYQQLSLKNIALLLSGFFAPALPLLIFELRHHFIISQAILKFSKGEAGLGSPFIMFINNLTIFFQEINKVFLYPYLDIAITLFALSLVILIWSANKKFIYLFFLLPLVTLSFFKRGAIGFFLIHLMPLSLGLIAYFLTKLPKIFFIPLMALIIFINTKNDLQIYQPNNALIPIGNANLITIQDRKNIIDWLYQQADDQPFSVWFYTIPYFQEEVWDYMFSWYAKDKYQYLPEKTSSFSAQDLKESKMFFSIYEPDENSPSRLSTWQTEALNNFGSINTSFSSHDLYIQKHSWQP